MGGYKISQLRNIDRKLKDFNKDEIVSIGSYINNILPDEFKRFCIADITFKGPARDIKKKVKDMLYILEKNNRRTYLQAVEYIEQSSIKEEPIVEKKKVFRNIDEERDNIFVRRLFELFEIIYNEMSKLAEKEILKNGFDFFLKWNKINPNIEIIQLRDLIDVKDFDDPTSLDYYLENYELLQQTLNDFFSKFKNIEIKILFIGFAFWGYLNNLLKESNEEIYVTSDKLPIINIKIFEMISIILKDNKINEQKIREIFEDIYDKTEDFKIKIEPWLSY